MTRAPRVQTGLERVRSDATVARHVRDRRVGLLAHPASVASDFAHARDVVRAAGGDIRALFGPEHGFGGEAQDMIGVAGARDHVTGAPIHSLYGSTYASLSPKREWLEGLDVVVIDLQDAGSRYYTFVWTAVLMARACAAAGVETLVLDRPNPLGGSTVEGGPQLRDLCSFVGLRPVPVRHGLTIGEIVLDAAREERLEGVRVAAMHGWHRDMHFEDTSLPWVLPSPNMPTVDVAWVYPGGCLLEGTNLSEGRGSTRPFELFGAPWVDGVALSAAIADDAGTGCVARPLVFMPTFHKHAGKLCGGIELHVTDREGFRPYRAYLTALRQLRRHDCFQWRSDAYEFVDEHPAIDLLTGDPSVRAAIDADAPVDEIVSIGADRLRDWDARSRWIYGDARSSAGRKSASILA